mgnify:CR=1 FL=1
MRWNRYRRDRQIIAAVLVFTVIVAAGIALQPGFHPPSSRTTGDKQLVSILTPLLNGARGQVAAALITPQGVRYGLWGSEYTTQYEIASLSKTMTASLLLELFAAAKSPRRRRCRRWSRRLSAGAGRYPGATGFSPFRTATLTASVGSGWLF